MTIFLCLILFLSGASALVFEALWVHLLGLCLGNGVWATSVVLAAFMGGLGLGNYLSARYGCKIQRNFYFYAFLELVIAVSGLSAVLLLPELTYSLANLFRYFTTHTLTINVFRITIAFIFMLVPTSAMGATLPILTKALNRVIANYGNALGLLYACNTLGAVVGVMGCELLFINWLGIAGTGKLAAAGNLLATIGAVLLAWRYEKKTVTISQVSFFRFHRASYRYLAASCLAGFAFLAMEVIWFRFMMLYFNAYGINFAIMLAVVLLGISVGGFIVSAWFGLDKNAHRFIVILCACNGLLVVTLYSNFNLAKDLVNLFVDIFGQAADGIFPGVLNHIPIIIFSMFMMFPVSIISGIMFTGMGKSLHDIVREDIRATGLLTLANTLGSMVGSITAGWLLLPYLGMENSFLFLALLYGVIALILIDKNMFQTHRYLKISICFVPFVLLVWFFPYGQMEDIFSKSSINQFATAGEKRVFYREGQAQTIQYLRKDLAGVPYYFRLVTNNHSMSNTIFQSKRYMKLFAYLPTALNPGIENALLVCFGCGSTAKAMTENKTLKHIDIVDISREVIDSGGIVFPDDRENPIHDPRVTVHIEDGRFFLLTSNRKYDLITAEPPPPAFNGVVNLYSQEYFQLVYNSLKDGGIVTYWLPVYQLQPDQAKSVLRAFCEVFEHASLWTGAGFEWMMVGIKKPLSAVSCEDFSRQWNNPTAMVEMKNVGILSPSHMGSLFIADGERLRVWIADTPPVTDNFPYRLSHQSYGIDIWNYREFMAPDKSLDSFMQSKTIATVWPETLKNSTIPLLASRKVLDEILIQPQYRKEFYVKKLHACIHDPELREYILFALDSDLDAQKIIDETHVTRDEFDTDVYHHLAARAVAEKQYLLAEKYYALLTKADGWTPLSRDQYYYLRIYLKFLSGDKNQAVQISQEFIHFEDDKQEQRERRMERYLKWLEEII